MVCKQLNIDPATLHLKEKKDFQKEDLAEDIIEIRYNHWIQRRQKHLDLLEQAIVSGGTRVVAPGKDSPMKSRTSYSPKLKIPENMRVHGHHGHHGHNHGHYHQTHLVLTDTKSSLPFDQKNQERRQSTSRPGQTTTRNRKNSSLGLGLPLMNKSMGSRDELALTFKKKTMHSRLQASSERPPHAIGTSPQYGDNLSVPLRVPLDLAYSNGNRKLANTIFKAELI